MSRELAKVIAAGKALDSDEREVASLASGHVEDDEQAEIDGAWNDEIDRRIQDVLTGTVELVDGEETRRIVRAELAARRCP